MEIKERVARAIFWREEQRFPKFVRHQMDDWDEKTGTAGRYHELAEAALRALAEAGPTDGMVEKAAKMMNDEALKYRVSLIQGFSNYPNSTRHWIRDFTRKRGDDVIWEGGPSHDEMMAELLRIQTETIARAALQAALKDMA